jgi:putative FmdB family regulatory protein
MPIFEYVCEDCGTSFEKLVRRPEANGVACPSCGHGHLKQQFSTFAARATSGNASAELPACPGGTCRTPELCGRN